MQCIILNNNGNKYCLSLFGVSVWQKGGTPVNEDSACCFFCGWKLQAGDERLALLNHVMCPSCEKQLINTDIRDDKYLLFKEKIKRIWFANKTGLNQCNSD